MQVYIGPIALLEQNLSSELNNEDELKAAIAQHTLSRARTLLAGRALLKYALKQEGLLLPGMKLPTLHSGDLGKPSLQWPDGSNGALWDFNLSHSHGMMALSLGKGAMGIDLERCNLKRLNPPLLKKILTEDERLACVALGLAGMPSSADAAGAGAADVAASGAAKAAPETAMVIVADHPAKEPAEALHGERVLDAQVLQVTDDALAAFFSHPVEQWAYLQKLLPRLQDGIWRQGLFWTQQWTVRECAVKVIGQSIFSYEKLKLNVLQGRLDGKNLPAGTIYCYVLWALEKDGLMQSVQFVTASAAGAGMGTTSTFSLLPQSLIASRAGMSSTVLAGLGTFYLLSVFVPQNESLTLNLCTRTWESLELRPCTSYTVGAS